MKNIVEYKFSHNLKMTEIEMISKLQKFEILENNYYKELKNLKVLIINSGLKSKKVKIIMKTLRKRE